MSDFHVTTQRRARKPRVCDLCNQAIERTELYDFGRGVFDGMFYTWKQHRECNAVTQAWWHGTSNTWEDAPACLDEYMADLADALSHREETDRRERDRHPRVCGLESDPESPPLGRASLGWRAIEAKMPEGVNRDRLASLRALYVERVGCPDCGAWRSDEAGCVCAT